MKLKSILSSLIVICALSAQGVFAQAVFPDLTVPGIYAEISGNRVNLIYFNGGYTKTVQNCGVNTAVHRLYLIRDGVVVSQSDSGNRHGPITLLSGYYYMKNGYYYCGKNAYFNAPDINQHVWHGRYEVVPSASQPPFKKEAQIYP